MTKNRLEAFSDGVIAIIITIMVLELKVPVGWRNADSCGGRRPRHGGTRDDHGLAREPMACW